MTWPDKSNFATLFVWDDGPVAQRAVTPAGRHFVHDIEGPRPTTEEWVWDVVDGLLNIIRSYPAHAESKAHDYAIRRRLAVRASGDTRFMAEYFETDKPELWDIVVSTEPLPRGNPLLVLTFSGTTLVAIDGFRSGFSSRIPSLLGKWFELGLKRSDQLRWSVQLQPELTGHWALQIGSWQLLGVLPPVLEADSVFLPFYRALRSED